MSSNDYLEWPTTADEMIASWGISNPPEKRELQEFLVEQALLQTVHVGSKKQKRYRPTGKGKEIGIGEKNHFGPYPLYSLEASGSIRELWLSRLADAPNNLSALDEEVDKIWFGDAPEHANLVAGPSSEDLKRQFRRYLCDCYGEVNDAVNSRDPEMFNKLKDVRFYNGYVPDYCDPVTASYYQLRYACGYAFEYYCMYRLLLLWMRRSNVDQLSVSSIGCGMGLDYYSLQRAIADTGAFEWLRPFDEQERITVRGLWTGVELADSGEWGQPGRMQENMERPFPSDEKILKYAGGASDYFSSFCCQKPAGHCPSNVFFFPRVLSEIVENNEAIDALLRAIRNAYYWDYLSGTPVWICIANRAGGGKEVEASRKVIEAFRDSNLCHTKVEYLGPGMLEGALRFDTDDWMIAPSEEGGQCLAIRMRSRGDGRLCSPCAIGDLVADGSFSLPDERPNIQGFIPFIVSRECQEANDCNRQDAQGKSCEASESNDGKCPVDMNPVSTTSQMHFQIIKLSAAR